jgi:hypothetical protein
MLIQWQYKPNENKEIANEAPMKNEFEYVVKIALDVIEVDCLA